MNAVPSALSYFKNNKIVSAYAVMRLVLAGLMAGLVAVSLIGNTSSDNVSLWLTDIIPLTFLTAMSVLWAVFLLRLTKSDRPGASLSALTVVSLVFTIIAIAALFVVILSLLVLQFAVSPVYDTPAEPYDYERSNSGLSFLSVFVGLFLVLFFIVAVCLVLTMIPRWIFYRSVNRSLKQEMPVVSGASFYEVMKIISAVGKAAGLTLILLALIDAVELHNDTAVILQRILAVVILLLWIVADIFEVCFVLGYKRFVTGIQHSAPPQAQPAVYLYGAAPMPVINGAIPTAQAPAYPPQQVVYPAYPVYPIQPAPAQTAASPASEVPVTSAPTPPPAAPVQTQNINPYLSDQNPSGTPAGVPSQNPEN